MKKLSLFILLPIFLVSTSLLASNLSVINKNTKILENGKSVGVITVLTPVKKVNVHQVKIRGFRLENYPQMVVRDMTRGEIYVEFNEENEDIALKTFKTIKSYEDEYGEIWNEVEGTIAIDSANVNDNVQSLYKQAKTTYEQTCSMCHHLPKPKAYTVNQWPQQIEMMMEQIPLDKPIKALITKYLQHNAVDANKKEN